MYCYGMNLILVLVVYSIKNRGVLKMRCYIFDYCKDFEIMFYIKKAFVWADWKWGEQIRDNNLWETPLS